MLICLLVLGYLVGSIPIGVLVAKAHGVDIFQFGSGNPGATNVMRALGRAWGMGVFVADLLKGVIPVLVARHYLPDHKLQWALVGFAAVLGHCFSPFLKFRGGKGIATALGVVLATTPLVAVGAFLLFLLTIAVFGFMSLSAMVASVGACIFAVLLHEPHTISGAYVLLAIALIYRHKKNIVRLREGIEPKFTFGKSDPSTTPASQPNGD